MHNIIPRNFLFYYLPGARGDFLSQIIKNQFMEVDPELYSLPSVYPKLHPQDLGNQLTIKQALSNAKDCNLTLVRILGQTNQDFYEISDLFIRKNKPQLRGQVKGAITLSKAKECYNGEITLKPDYQKSQENLDLDYRHLYDYTVYFRDLWNINSIKVIYNTITGQDLIPEAIKRIQINLDIHRQWPISKR